MSEPAPPATFKAWFKRYGGGRGAPCSICGRQETGGYFGGYEHHDSARKLGIVCHTCAVSIFLIDLDLLDAP